MAGFHLWARYRRPPVVVALSFVVEAYVPVAAGPGLAGAHVVLRDVAAVDYSLLIVSY